MTTVTAPAATATTWNIDSAHSSAQFKVKHMMISNVKGEFTTVTGTLKHDSENVASCYVEASIDARTISTREPQRDEHLKGADFLDVEKYPALTFKSTSVTKKSAGELEVTGDLTIHGVTRPVTFEVEGPTAPAKDPWGNTRVGLSATARINRKDFGLTWNAALETGGILVGEDVTITLDIQFVQA